MDRLDAMLVFQTVVESGSLSAAGRRLGMPLATVSRKISDLERYLKTRLLHRSTRQLELTDAGHSYLAACERILESVDEAERAAAGEYTKPRGELVITAPIVFGRVHVLPVITEFLRAYPEVDVRLSLLDRTVNLLEDHIDLALRIGELPDSSLNAIRLGKIRRVVCASPGYLAERGMPKTPDELREHQCIRFESMATSGAWPFRIKEREVSVPIHSRLTVSTAEAAIDAASCGFGVTRVLSYQIAEEQKAGQLNVVLSEFEVPALPVHLVYSPQGRLPVKLRAFLDFAQPKLRQRLSDPSVPSS
jgi:DNA-binding transcriptional LysR family regulator